MNCATSHFGEVESRLVKVVGVGSERCCVMVNGVKVPRLAHASARAFLVAESRGAAGRNKPSRHELVGLRLSTTSWGIAHQNTSPNNGLYDSEEMEQPPELALRVVATGSSTNISVLALQLSWMYLPRDLTVVQRTT